MIISKTRKIPANSLHFWLIARALNDCNQKADNNLLIACISYKQHDDELEYPILVYPNFGYKF